MLIYENTSSLLMDPRTTVLIGSITCGLMAIVLSVLARATPLSVPGLRSWVIGAWLIFLAMMLLGLRDWISDLVSVTLANTALVLAYIVWLAGTSEHFGKRIEWVRWITAAACAAVALTWFAYAQESFRVRVVIVTALCSIINIRHALLALRTSAGNRDASSIGVSITVTWLLVLAAVYGLRGLHAAALPQGNTGLLTQDAIQIVYTGAFTICNLLLVIGFATMASDFVRMRIEEQAVRDPLTGAANRRALTAALELEFSRSKRHGHTFCIAMLDIDHFKHINDQHGHQMGDRVLVHMCRRLASLIRPHDVLARYGGEEFLILMPETTGASAIQAAQRILSAVAVSEDTSLPSITVSIGLAEWSLSDASAEALVARADSALYTAKNSGRNRAEMARGSC